MLACSSLHAVNRENVQQSVELINMKYSSDLKNLIMWVCETQLYLSFCWSLAHQVHCILKNLLPNSVFTKVIYFYSLKIINVYFLRYLLRQPPANHVKSINDVMPMIGARFYTQLDATQLRCDVLYSELAKVYF